jgi:hypothetical protein
MILLFVLPVYVSFEKKDDLAYSLALKSTTEFVEATRIKGYISYQSYNNFLLKLSATGNIYDVRMEHKAKKFYPVINAYTDNTYKVIAMQFDYNPFKNSLATGSITYQGHVYTNLKVASKEVTELYNEKQIIEVIQRTNVTAITDMTQQQYRDLSVLPNLTNMYTLSNQEKNSIYVMNLGDEFNVIIRNTNTTLATELFNIFTIGSAGGENTRVYVNYGGTVVSENYVGNL